MNKGDRTVSEVEGATGFKNSYELVDKIMGAQNRTGPTNRSNSYAKSQV